MHNFWQSIPVLFHGLFVIFYHSSASLPSITTLSQFLCVMLVSEAYVLILGHAIESIRYDQMWGWPNMHC